jgi:DNA-binding transcriptional LysR family regulator
LPCPSQSSVEILRGLEDFSIDVGLTYLDNEPIEGMRSEAIYMERYCLPVRADHEIAGKAFVTWAEAAKQPLCLLTPNNPFRSKPAGDCDDPGHLQGLALVSAFSWRADASVRHVLFAGFRMARSIGTMPGAAVSSPRSSSISASSPSLGTSAARGSSPPTARTSVCC